MAFSDHIAAMARASLKTFGESVTYDPAAGAPVGVVGIFDAQYVLAKGPGDPMFAGVEAGVPKVFLLLVDLPTDPEFDDPVLTIRSVNYKVIERRPDGMGGIVLALRKV
jgi:hypothetical protein